MVWLLWFAIGCSCRDDTDTTSHPPASIEDSEDSEIDTVMDSPLDTEEPIDTDPPTDSDDSGETGDSEPFDPNEDEDEDGVPNGLDCGVEVPDIYPGAPELCDGIDNDCDDSIDEAAVNAPDWYLDDDGDGFGAGIPFSSCEPVLGRVDNVLDCDDENPAIHPDAIEVCDIANTDENCSGTSDDGDIGVDPSTYVVGYKDFDGDGFANGSLACDPALSVLPLGDCDDLNAAVNPNETEICNGIDDNCNGSTDGTDVLEPVWYSDGDGDGFGANQLGSPSCTPLPGMVDISGDCDDSDVSIFPTAEDVCDGVDRDCSGAIEHLVASSEQFSTAAAIADGEQWICVQPGSYEFSAEVTGNVTVFGNGATVTNSEIGPVFQVTGGRLQISDLVFQNAAAGIVATASEVELFNSSFLNSLDNAIFLQDSQTQLWNVVVEAGEEAAIVQQGGELTVMDSRFSENSGTQGAVIDSNALLIIDNSIFEDNSALNQGGALWLDGADVSIYGSSFFGNQADDGGAIAAINASLTTNDLQFSGNVATNGGAVSLEESTWSGGGVQASENSANRGGVIEASDSVIELSWIQARDNVASQRGGVASVVGGQLTLRNSIFDNNDGNSRGGGINIEQSGSLVLENTTLTRNQGSSGGAIYATNASVQVINVIFAWNPGNGAIYLQNSSLSARYSDWWGQSTRVVGASDPVGTLGNLAVDPKFIMIHPQFTGTPDFHLGITSTLRHVGDPTLLDPDNLRSTMGAFGGPYADLGYYEDRDADLMFDGWEERFGVDDPSMDEDSDGIPTEDEFLQGSDPLNPDTDGDGVWDGAEVLAGTHWLDPTDF